VKTIGQLQGQGPPPDGRVNVDGWPAELVRYATAAPAECIVPWTEHGGGYRFLMGPAYLQPSTQAIYDARGLAFADAAFRGEVAVEPEPESEPAQAPLTKRERWLTRMGLPFTPPPVTPPRWRPFSHWLAEARRELDLLLPEAR